MEFDKLAKKYFPKWYEKNKMANMTPRDLGQYLASKSLRKIFGAEH